MVIFKEKGVVTGIKFRYIQPAREGCMPKMKTHKGAAKRFRVKSSGVIKRKKKNLRHLLSNKSSKRKRQLGQMTYVHSSDLKSVKKQLGMC